MDCTSPSPTAAPSAPSACVQQSCIFPVLDCNNAPAWDLYDTQPCDGEAALFGSVMCEFNDIAGFPIEYRILLAKNERLYGEDPNANLTEPVLTKAVYEPSEETTILNAWGLMADDTMQYIVIPKTTFNRDFRFIFTTTPELSGRSIRPMPGDVIRTIHNDRNYEVVDTGETSAIFQGKSYTWELIVRPYRFSEQSDGHREVYIGMEDDPFETITTGPTGQPVPQNNYTTEVYGDNTLVENESERIDDYRDVIDPDQRAFGL